MGALEYRRYQVYGVGVRITVVGAGVVGLATALVLEEHGHEVRVVASGFGEDTTSAVAGAVWFPYRAGPPHKVTAWAARTREMIPAMNKCGADTEVRAALKRIDTGKPAPKTSK